MQSSQNQSNKQGAQYLVDLLLDKKTIDTYLHLSKEKKRNILKLIFTKYLDYSEIAITELQHKIASDDNKSIENLAHTLKSSSAQVGALHLSALYRQIESDAVHHRLDNLNTDFLSEVIQLHTDVSKAIRFLIENSQNLINSYDA